MTAAKCVSRECFGKRPAVTPSWIIAWMRGRAAISAPRCVGAAMSLSVACPMLSSVKPGKSFSRDRYPTSSWISAARCSCRIVWPCSRRMWLVRLTPRLSRRRANSVCGSWQSCTRSFMARMTSALAKSFSAINRRGANGDSKSNASGDGCGEFGHVLHIANPPLRRRCI